MFQTTNQLESDLQAATVLADKALRLSVGKNRTAMFGPWACPVWYECGECGANSMV